MAVAEWLLVVAIACLFAFFVLRPDNFGRGKRSSDSGDSGGGYYSTDRTFSDDRTRDPDGGGDGDGGRGDGGGDGD